MMNELYDFFTGSSFDAKTGLIILLGSVKGIYENIPIVEIQNVFVQSGVPEHTFVQPVEYTRLLVALRTDGRSVIIE